MANTTGIRGSCAYTGRKLDHVLAGVIRLEVRAALGLENASRIANFSAHELPRFVSSPARDPRAPQNLARVEI